MQHALRSVFICLLFGGLGFVLASVIWSVAQAIWDDAWNRNFLGVIGWLLGDIVLAFILLVYVPIVATQVLQNKTYHKKRKVIFGIVYDAAGKEFDLDDDAFAIVLMAILTGIVLVPGTLWGWLNVFAAMAHPRQPFSYMAAIASAAIPFAFLATLAKQLPRYIRKRQPA